MSAIKYSRRSLTREEIWFDAEPDVNQSDIVIFKQRTLPVVGAQCEPFYTMLIDLSKSPEEILAACCKTNQYKIRRARDKDKLTYTSWFGRRASETLDRFCDRYDRFVGIKTSLKPADRKYLGLLANAEALDLSCMSDEQGNDLVWHAHYRNQERGRLLHSVSLFREHEDTGFRNFIGRANRLHHWMDFLRFKNDGLSTYDFGGWYEKDSDAQRLSINRFKEEFGGTVVKNYNCILLASVKARLFMALARSVKKVAPVLR